MSYAVSKEIQTIQEKVNTVIITYSRFNLSLAIVAMVKHTRVHHHHHENNTENNNNTDVMKTGTYCERDNNLAYNDNDESLGEFDWNEAEQGLILGSFFWGYFLTQLPVIFTLMRVFMTYADVLFLTGRNVSSTLWSQMGTWPWFIYSSSIYFSYTFCSKARSDLVNCYSSD